MSPRVNVQIGGRSYDVQLDDGKIFVNGELIHLQDVSLDSSGGLQFSTGEFLFKSVVDRGTRESFLLCSGREFALDLETDHHRLLRSLVKTGDVAAGRKEIKASMPGLVVRVLGQLDQDVHKGEAVLILEAMKMENEIRAPFDGKIREIKTQQGATVERGDVLIVLESHP